MMRTYELVDEQGLSGIRCLCCGSVSYHPQDVAQRYCGCCHLFHEETSPKALVYPI
jgi:ribosomal protein L37E